MAVMAHGVMKNGPGPNRMMGETPRGRLGHGPVLQLSILCSLLATGGCSERVCESHPPTMQIILELGPHVAASSIQSLRASISAAGLSRDVTLDPGPLRVNRRATFVVEVGPAGAKGFSAEVSVQAYGAGDRVIARGSATFSGSGDACNAFTLLLSSVGQDGGPAPDGPRIDSGQDSGEDSGQDSGKDSLTCGAASCSGCCESNGTCSAGTTDSACGKGGVACKDCTLNSEVCSEGTCCAPVCTGKLCGDADGCGGTCQAGSGCSPCVFKGDASTLLLYTFEGSGTTVADVAGSNPGSLQGSGLTRVNGKAGCGKALSFSGAGYVEIPDAALWDLPQGSVDLWIRFDGPTSDAEGLVSRDANGNAKPGHFTLVRMCTGQLMARLQNSTGGWGRCSKPVSHGVWHHVGVNFGGPGGLKLYVDGVEAVETTDITCGSPWSCGDSTAIGIDGNDNPWTVGATSWTSTEGSATPVGNHLSGRIDSFRISNARRSF